MKGAGRVLIGFGFPEISRKLPVFLLCCFLFLLLSAASAVVPAASAVAETPRIKVVVTTGMIADLAEKVGGDRVEVTALMGPGVDPHLYKATGSDLRLIEGADIIFYNGVHLEGKIADILEKFSKKKPCFPVTADIDPAKLRKPPEFEGLYDPHVWFDVALWEEALAYVHRQLVSFSAPDTDYFGKNFSVYSEEFKNLDRWVRDQIALIPPSQRVLITAHDAFGYFGRAYNIEVRGLQGLSTATEFGLHDLKELVDLIIDRKIKAVFVESSVPEKFILSLKEGVVARGFNVEVGGELFSDAMGAAGTPEGTYPGMIRHNVTTIVNALK